MLWFAVISAILQMYQSYAQQEMQNQSMKTQADNAVNKTIDDYGAVTQEQIQKTEEKAFKDFSTERAVNDALSSNEAIIAEKGVGGMSMSNILGEAVRQGIENSNMNSINYKNSLASSESSKRGSYIQGRGITNASLLIGDGQKLMNTGVSGVAAGTSAYVSSGGKF